MEWIFLVVIPGLVLGVIFGFILQRGRFCMNSAFRDIVLLKEYNLIKAVMIAWFVSMIGFSIMAFSGIITLNPKPFAPVANIIGGLIFGMGMVLGAGCASGTTYRVGEGMVGSWFALLGFMIGAVGAAFGFLKDITSALQSFNLGQITLIGEDSGLLLAIFMIIIGIVGLAFMTYRWILPDLKKKKENGQAMLDFSNMGEKIFKKGWKWAPTGIAIGILACFAYISSAATGRNYPLGITGGWRGFLLFLTTGDLTYLSWEPFLVIGVVFGAFIFAKIAGEFKLRAPKPGTLLIQLLGGLMMGAGAIIAMGCNIGHALSGVPMLSIGSIIATGSIILGCWILVYLMFMRV